MRWFWLALMVIAIWPWSGFAVQSQTTGQRFSWRPAVSCAAVTNPNCPGEATSPADPETSTTPSPTPSSTLSADPSPSLTPTPSATSSAIPTPTATAIASPTPVPTVYDPPFEYCDFYPLDIACGGPGESPVPSPILSPTPTILTSPELSPDLSPSPSALVSPSATQSDPAELAYCDLFPEDPLCQLPVESPIPAVEDPLPTPTLDGGPVETAPIEQSASLEAFIIYCQAINYSDPLCPAAPAN